MIPNYLYSRLLLFEQALHFYFNVVISNSYFKLNFIFEQIFFFFFALIKVS